jgi:hypothetical protein
MKNRLNAAYCRPEMRCFVLRVSDVITDSIDDWMWDDYEDEKEKARKAAKKEK